MRFKTERELGIPAGTATSRVTNVQMNTKLTRLIQEHTNFLATITSGRLNGTCTIGGTFWPGSKRKLGEAQGSAGVTYARQILMKGRILADNAVNRSDEAALKHMEKWFGKKTDIIGQKHWKAALLNLKILEYYMNGDIRLYYRGHKLGLVGKTSDVPGDNSLIEDDDIECVAYTFRGDKDLAICLAKDFFDMNAKSFRAGDMDHVGGTFIHELTHNVCYTRDHIYRPANCVDLARNNPLRAWDNASNYQFFCCSLFEEKKKKQISGIGKSKFANFKRRFGG